MENIDFWQVHGIFFSDLYHNFSTTDHVFCCYLPFGILAWLGWYDLRLI